MADSEVDRGDVFEVERIRNLVELMREFDLREIDLKQADQRIRLCRGVDLPATHAGAPAATSAFVAPPAAATPASSTVATSSPPSAAQDGANIVYIKSPMVGTFFGRPNPDSDPYVKVGDLVDVETTVCVIEAMKVFNEIPAEVRGRILAVLVDDEEAVEYGRQLFKVDTSP
jgi:acetyl-CoA carboxylase biotin carboxyl carrier protein